MVLILPLLCLLAVVQSDSDGMEDARRLIRHGLLTSAEERLEALGELPDASMKAGRELLLGNISYERGDYAQARSRYVASIQVMDAASVAPEDASRNAARTNLDMAKSQLSRQAALETAAAKLSRAVGFVLAIAVLGVVLLHRLSRPRAEGMC